MSPANSSRAEHHTDRTETRVEPKSEIQPEPRIESTSNNNNIRCHDETTAAIPGPVLAVAVTPSQEYGVDHPDGGTRAWVVVFGTTLNMAATYGLITGVGLFQVYWKEHELKDYSATEIAWIISVFGFLTILLAGPVGVLFDRWGSRRLLFPAAAVYFGAFLGLAFSFKFEQFLGCFIVAGVSSGRWLFGLYLIIVHCLAFITTISTAVVNHWFLRRKGLAMGVTTMGSGIGGFFFSVVLKPLFEKLAWRQGILVLSCIVCASVTIGALCIKARIPARTDRFFDFSCFKSWKFLLTTLSVFGFELVLFAGWGMIPTYAKKVGLGNEFYLMLALNIGSTLGRLLPGYLADKLGSFNVTLVMASLTLVTMLGIWLPVGGSSVVALYMVSMCVGFGTGSFVATSATFLGHLCSPQDAGEYLGSSYTIVSLATLASNPICQAILDAHGEAALVWFLSAVLLVAGVSCAMARWILMGRKWKWAVKV